MRNTAVGCAGWLFVGAFAASLFRFSGGAAGNLGVWIFLGGLALFLVLYSFASQRSERMTRIAAPSSFDYMNSQAAGYSSGYRDASSQTVSYRTISSQAVGLEAIRRKDVGGQAVGQAMFAATPAGCVYLLKAGPFYKIGRSQLFEQRLRQIRQQLPYPVEVVYVFETDRMIELEVYWHGRFQERRTHSDWFLLTDEDVYEFTQQV